MQQARQQSQPSAQYSQFLPVNDQILQKRLSSPTWSTRKQAYEQVLYLIQEIEVDPEADGLDREGRLTERDKQVINRCVFNIGGRQYTVKKLITMFQDICQEEHPVVLGVALQCVQAMIDRRLCTGREFVKLTNQGFDKFPLRTNKGKEILQKFADIIQKIDLQPHFLSSKLNYSVHEKCINFALQVVAMLGMTQLIGKVKQIAQKHPKSAVKQVANEIYQQLLQLQQNQQDGEGQIQQQQNNRKLVNKNNYMSQKQQNLNSPQKKKTTKVMKKKTPSKTQSQTNSFNFNKAQLEILEKVAQYEQLNSKEQQKYCEGLVDLFDRYYRMARQGKIVPALPMNQLTNLSYIVRLMIQSNNAIISTSGLKLLKLLSQQNSPLLPRSFPLLFIFQKFRLHATHQINQLLYQLCDSLLLANSVSCNRNVDLLLAVAQGAGNKKTNVKFGSFMVFLRAVAVLYASQRLFGENFGGGDTQDNGTEEGQPENQRMSQIYNKINQSDLQRVKQKLQKNLVKCLQNFSSKLKDDKKYQQKLQDIRIAMSIAYGTSYTTGSNCATGTGTSSAVSSLDNLNMKNKSLKKNLSNIGPKIQTFNQRIYNKAGQGVGQSSNNQPNLKSTYGIDQQKIKSTTTSTRSLMPGSIPQSNYKIINPQQKLTKILNLSQNPQANTSMLKKLINQSLSQIQQCLNQYRFQLFYYVQILQNFISKYEPNDKTCDLVSQYMEQLLVKLSKIRNTSKTNASKNNETNEKFQAEALTTIIKICTCDLVLGEQVLLSILANLAQSHGIQAMVQALIVLDQSKPKRKPSYNMIPYKKATKVKKKNRKPILSWLDANVPTQCLSDRLFDIMEKIEKGEPLGAPVKEQDNIQQYDTNYGCERVDEKKGEFRETFGNEKEKKQKQKQKELQKQKNLYNIQKNPFIQQQPPSPKMQKQITFNNSNKKSNNIQKSDNLDNEEQSQYYKIQKTNQIIYQNKTKASSNSVASKGVMYKRQIIDKQLPDYNQLRYSIASNNQLPTQPSNPKPSQPSSNISSPRFVCTPHTPPVFANSNTPTIPKNPPPVPKPIPNTHILELDHSEISHIEYKEDQSISEGYMLASGGGTDRDAGDGEARGKARGSAGGPVTLIKYVQTEVNEQYTQKIIQNSSYNPNTMSMSNLKFLSNPPSKPAVQQYASSYSQYTQGEGQLNGDDEDNNYYQKYYRQSKFERQIQLQIPNSFNNPNSDDNDKNLQIKLERNPYKDDLSLNEETEENRAGFDAQNNADRKIEDYKEYIKKIRQTYLPSQYINNNMTKKQQNSDLQPKFSSNVCQQQQQDRSSGLPKNSGQATSKTSLVASYRQSNQAANMRKQQEREQIPIKKPENTNNQGNQHEEDQQQQEVKQQYEYKYINKNKLTYMLKNATNPFSHLRNQILLPFKKTNPPQKQQFVKQIELYIQQLGELKQPQPYNSLLLCIILLFSQIHTCRTLITPLQQLYQHMASQVSTNEFLRTILGLFHSVIEQTEEALRNFLLSILTKSVARLMPFIENPVELLRDIGQFYNVGENVYFQLYQIQYKQICKVLEGDALYQVVEKALIQQGENLAIIIGSWFETTVKKKILQYINRIIQENAKQQQHDQQMEGIGGQEGFQPNQQYF